MLELPGSNMRGVFPRGLLPPSERIVYETRPGYFRLYWGRFVLCVLLFALFLGPVEQPGYLENPAFYFFEGLLVLVILLSVQQWRMTAYALTSQRVVRVGGIRQTEFRDAFYAAVQNLSIDPGFSGGVRFDTGGASAGYPGAPPPSRARVIRWTGLADAPRVYAFLQRAFALHSPPSGVVAGPPLLAQGTPGSALWVCPRCGMVADPRWLSPHAPVCPSCGNPFPRMVPGR
jgi:hypothetical protein